jgi:bifunctional ADP-heptose synthase (sugar kinase/adenylyltransferase)
MSNIVVIGESCIDEYVYGTCDRVCPEAAALCFRHSNYKTVNSGMAGNTYENLKALNDNDQHKIDLITCRSTIIKRRFIDKKYNSIIFRDKIIKYSNLIVTKGEKGATFYSKNEIKDFATEKVILRDVCGAGDTFLAGLVIKYSETKDINESIKYANACACKVVAKFGVVTV